VVAAKDAARANIIARLKGNGSKRPLLIIVQAVTRGHDGHLAGRFMIAGQDVDHSRIAAKSRFDFRKVRRRGFPAADRDAPSAQVAWPPAAM